MSDTTTDVKVGRTLVRVKRKDINERTNKVTISVIHEGVVIQKTSTHVRIYSAAPVDKGGDHTPEVAQLYPMRSERCWCEKIGEKNEDNPFPIPPLFR